MIYQFKPLEKTEMLRGHLNLGGRNNKNEEIDVTSHYFLRNHKPWIPVMGEFHFSRYDRSKWREELCKMKAGGITLVATYLFWIYHEELEGEFDFSGDRDIRAFVEECQAVGLDVVLRIGPWAHGECRNGGFPDWLLEKPYELRDNNPQYLEKVHIWYSKIYEQVQGLFYKDGGNIVMVQLENEFVNNAEHLAKLKEVAVECGIVAPIYTVTGWNSVGGAKIPVDEVVPVFGGYCEAPWTAHLNKLEPSVHYFFNQMRNDSAIGADLIAVKSDDNWQLPYERYPFATCELGGGIQITHHRRPIISGMDIYAVSLIKLGSGNNLPGYYMYHGGSNKIGKLSTLNESKATGYPNDYPVISYDFQAALSEYGEVREQYRLLNMLHLFLQDFGETFAPMAAVDSEVTVSRYDNETLRYGMRTDGAGGFVFVNHYQRLTKLKDIKGAEFVIGNVAFPPIDICGEISFFMPFHMLLGDNILEWATAQPVCRAGNTYFFAEIPGIKAEYRFEKGAAFSSEAGLTSAFEINGIKVVTLTWEQAGYTRRLSKGIYVGVECDLYEMDNKVCSVSDGEFTYYLWNGECFEEYQIAQINQSASVTFEDIAEPPFEPKWIQEMNIGGKRNISWKKITVDGSAGMVEIDYYGDAAQIYADEKLVADHYYYGKAWRVPAALLYDKECYLAVSEIRDDFYKEF